MGFYRRSDVDGGSFAPINEVQQDNLNRISSSSKPQKPDFNTPSPATTATLRKRPIGQENDDDSDGEVFQPEGTSVNKNRVGYLTDGGKSLSVPRNALISSYSRVFERDLMSDSRNETANLPHFKEQLQQQAEASKSEDKPEPLLETELNVNQAREQSKRIAPPGHTLPTPLRETPMVRA